MLSKLVREDSEIEPLRIRQTFLRDYQPYRNFAATKTQQSLLQYLRYVVL